MKKIIKHIYKIIKSRDPLILLIGIGLLISFLPAFSATRSNEKDVLIPIIESNKISSVKNDTEITENLEDKLIVIQENFIAPISEPFSSGNKTVNTMRVVVTAYSSTPQETWGDPFITASGLRVNDGIVANNSLPFGTKIRIPDIYGDKIFVVQDRMHSRKPSYQIDIWKSSTQDAINFGVQKTYIEILSSG